MKDILNKAAALWRKTDKTPLLRHMVQLMSFLLFPGLFLTVFNALRDVVMALVTGTFALSALSGSLVTLLAVVGVTALWGRFFCGYLCTFGAMQEFMAFAGKKLLPGLRKVPETVDKVLKYMKYGVLLAVVLLVWALQLPVDSTLSPWGVFGALLSGNLSVMADAIPTLGFGLLLGICVGNGGLHLLRSRWLLFRSPENTFSGGITGNGQQDYNQGNAPERIANAMGV